MATKKISLSYILGDASLWSLLFSNLVTIYFAVQEGWNLSVLMWIYWFQSVTIGIFNFLRILKLEEFSTEGVLINNKPVDPTASTKRTIAFFFLFHYGFFHLVYFFFLSADAVLALFSPSANPKDAYYILLSALLFFANHLLSFIYNRPRDSKKQNIGTLMFYPYARVLPMHIIITLAGIFGALMLPFFLLLKTCSDAIMHVMERKIRQGEQAPPSSE